MQFNLNFNFSRLAVGPMACATVNGIQARMRHAPDATWRVCVCVGVGVGVFVCAGALFGGFGFVQGSEIGLNFSLFFHKLSNLLTLCCAKA